MLDLTGDEYQQPLYQIFGYDPGAYATFGVRVNIHIDYPNGRQERPSVVVNAHPNATPEEILDTIAAMLQLGSLPFSSSVPYTYGTDLVSYEITQVMPGGFERGIPLQVIPPAV